MATSVGKAAARLWAAITGIPESIKHDPAGERLGERHHELIRNADRGSRLREERLTTLGDYLNILRRLHGPDHLARVMRSGNHQYSQSLISDDPVADRLRRGRRAVTGDNEHGDDHD